jgi:hypothetical protein
MKKSLLVLSALIGMATLPLARADILPPAPGGGYSYLPPQSGWDLFTHQGGYLSSAGYVGMYGGTVRLDQVFHYGFQSSYAPPAQGVTDTHTFGSLLQLTGAVNIGGGTWAPFQQTDVANTTTVRITGTMGLPGDYSTEMLALNLSALTPWGTLLIRESPTLASTGHTTLTPIVGGYQIDSFFDIYTELSLDDGMSWIPDAGGPCHVAYRCIPEPGVVAMAGLGLIGVMAMCRRVRKV